MTPTSSKPPPVFCSAVRRRHLLGNLCVLGAGVLFFGVLVFAPVWLDPAHWRDLWYYVTTDTQAEIRQIEETYGIDIRYEMTQDFLKETQQESSANGTATPISAFELSRYALLMPSWFDKYPPDVLTFNLKALYLSKDLNMNGVSYGGTYSYWEQRIYLHNNGRARGMGDAYLEAVFHHELSSLIMYNNFFPEQTWAAANPEGFEYWNDPDKALEALKHVTRSARRSTELFAQGMLRQYSFSTLENDVNEYAAAVFAYPNQMKQWVSEYPGVKKKYLILKQFYLRLSPDFAPVFEKIL